MQPLHACAPCCRKIRAVATSRHVCCTFATCTWQLPVHVHAKCTPTHCLSARSLVATIPAAQRGARGGAAGHVVVAPRSRHRTCVVRAFERAVRRADAPAVRAERLRCSVGACDGVCARCSASSTCCHAATRPTRPHRPAATRPSPASPPPRCSNRQPTQPCCAWPHTPRAVQSYQAVPRLITEPGHATPQDGRRP